MSQIDVNTPPKLARIMLPVLLIVSFGCLLASLILSPPKRSKPSAVENAPLIEVPDFHFTDRSGTPVSNADLLGKVWVASFIFTRCSGTCPMVTATFHKLQQDLMLAKQPNLRLVSFTMDPEFDTPEVLKAYADNPIHRAESDRWLFLTGSSGKVRELMQKTFKLSFEQNANPATPPGQKYDHGTFIFVVDKQGRVRGHFDGLKGTNDETGERYRENCARLVAKVNELLAE